MAALRGAVQADAPPDAVAGAAERLVAALDACAGVVGCMPRSDGGLEGGALDPDSIGPAELDALQRLLEDGGGHSASDGAGRACGGRLLRPPPDGQPLTAAAGSQPELHFEFGCWGHRFAGDSVLRPPPVGPPPQTQGRLEACSRSHAHPPDARGDCSADEDHQQQLRPDAGGDCPIDVELARWWKAALAEEESLEADVGAPPCSRRESVRTLHRLTHRRAIAGACGEPPSLSGLEPQVGVLVHDLCGAGSGEWPEGFAVSAAVLAERRKFEETRNAAVAGMGGHPAMAGASQAPLPIEIKNSTGGTNGVYLPCGTYGGRPLYKCPREEDANAPSCLYFWDGDGEPGWYVAVHPDSKVAGAEDEYEEFWAVAAGTEPGLLPSGPGDMGGVPVALQFDDPAVLKLLARSSDEPRDRQAGNPTPIGLVPAEPTEPM